MLSQYLANHGVVSYIHSTPEEIQSWLNAVPNPSHFEYVMYAFPLVEQGNMFRIRDVANWYGMLCLKVQSNQDVEVMMLGTTTEQRRNTVKQYLGLFIRELVEMHLFDVDMQSLMNNFMQRSSNALQMLLVLLVADGILTEPTLLKLQVELTPLRRWQSLSLEDLPTIEEITQALV